MNKISSLIAGVAELVYAPVSKTGEGNLVRVQVPPPALFIFPLFLSLLLIFSQTVSAESLKNFYLTNGTVISGELISYSGSTYTIRLPDQPEAMTIPESYIQRIESNTGAVTPAPTATTKTPNIVEFQNTILSDPSLMQEILSLLDDQEIMNALSDPELMDAAMSQDLDAIGRNPAIGKMMENPKFLLLLKKIQSRISPGTPSP